MKTNEILKLIGDKVFLDKIYQFSYRRCNTSDEAQDLCSDIVLAILCAFEKQESVENFYAFVWAVARRVYADFCQKRNQIRQVLSFENTEFSVQTPKNEIDNFIEETSEKEQMKKIFEEISFLSKAYRDVMVMYYLDEIKIKDIALKLGINETTVKQRLFFARNMVKKEVENMSERNLSLKPINLAMFGTGNPVGNDPRTKLDSVLSKNLIYLCKNKAKSAKELSEELCVPMPYIEDELEIQCRGENGTYGTLRKLENGKYITNVLLVDYSEYEEANKIYEKHLEMYIPILKENFEKQKKNILDFPYLTQQTDATFIMWSLISRTIWDLEAKVAASIKNNYFKHVEPAKRDFTSVMIAFTEDMNPRFDFYGCDGTYNSSILNYKGVFFSNIYGARKEKLLDCGCNITGNERLLFLTKALEGNISVDKLNATEKEIAAKLIESGYLKKCGELLCPQMVAYDRKFEKDFFDLSFALNQKTESIIEEIAKELSEFMLKNIPAHLINEYEYYTSLVAGVRFLHETIEACIKEGLLCEPKSKNGPEGVIMAIEKYS
ncbi:MAG: sigma-70 family RNA polymerase sigma factor [Clostridia bacterium]|nr:sigma-70 family RNA polymerase sigma factor [Clostridia bacterium]MBR6564187.1 sigma-70 family RNA polymerase sigma factor [Clostridia bacterium]